MNVHFKNCDDVNRNAGVFDISIPIQLLVSKSFRIYNVSCMLYK